MEQDINLIIEQYKENLFNLTNQSNLPLGVVRLIVNDFNALVEDNYQQYLKQAYEKKRKEAEVNNVEAEEISEPIKGEIV